MLTIILKLRKEILSFVWKFPVVDFGNTDPILGQDILMFYPKDTFPDSCNLTFSLNLFRN